MTWQEGYDIVEKAYLRIGLPTALVSIGLLAYFGILSSPVSALEKKIDEHIVTQTQVLQETQYQTRLLKEICKALRSPENCL